MDGVVSEGATPKGVDVNGVVAFSLPLILIVGTAGAGAETDPTASLTPGVVRSTGVAEDVARLVLVGFTQFTVY